MSSDSHFGIPIIELPTNSKDLDGGSDEWRSLCKSVREACENHGCFQELEELNHVIGLTIIDGYGLGEKREWLMKDYQLRRVMKYSAPPSGEYTKVVSAHTDKLCSALLCEDGISGLEIETKDGEWVKLCTPPGTFVFLYGDLNAWSNGRMHAANHRVMLRRTNIDILWEHSRFR
ncbi:probable 2-oxoglutarate-dependent dioxygenase AOP1 [Gossypium raimondii]|nr:probable 2-oxoglutarate-dependent dioxygenase AOP1 [Gossypium raimondii]